MSLLVLSEDGTILRGIGANDIYRGSGGDVLSGTYLEQGGAMYIITCASWITVGNTTADGSFCESYKFIQISRY